MVDTHMYVLATPKTSILSRKLRYAVHAGRHTSRNISDYIDRGCQQQSARTRTRAMSTRMGKESNANTIRSTWTLTSLRERQQRMLGLAVQHLQPSTALKRCHRRQRRLMLALSQCRQWTLPLINRCRSLIPSISAPQLPRIMRR